MLPKLSYQTNSYYYTKSNTNIKQEPIETEKPEVKKEEPVESSKVQSSSLEIIASQNQAMISRSTSPNKNINKPYEFEEVEIDGAIYYKTQNEKGEDCFVSAYIYHCKIEKTNSNEDITKILNTYSSNPYATENLYGFNNNNYTDNYGYTHSFTQENQYKHTETVKDTNGNIIREVTTNVNQNSGKITQVTSYSDGRKEVFVYTLDEDGEEVPLQKIEYDTNQQIISSTKIEYEDNGNIIMQVDKQDGSTEVTVYNEDGNILTTTTFDHGEEQNVVKHTEEDNESQQESAYARMKREQAEKAEAEKNKQNIIDKKPLEEQKTDLTQIIPEGAKKLPYSQEDKTISKQDNYTPVVKNHVQPEITNDENFTDDINFENQDEFYQEQQSQDSANQKAANNNTNNQNIYVSGPMEVQYSEQYGYILPEVTITAEAQKKTPEISSAGNIQNPYLEKIPVPEFDREKAEETIITKYGDENGIIDTDKMIEDFVDAGGEVITYVKNEKGELEKTNTHFTGGGARRTAIDSTGNVLGSDNLYSRLKQRGGIYDLSYNNEYYQEEPR